ncbi:hypothetical protein BJV82DRAFT_616746 [Fennellomyces sp. T-0311]|nr:hypothetical protein BJV82DRAFT_616746 [Fennellomyces sp. T-0311]
MSTLGIQATTNLYHFYEASDDDLSEFYENYLKNTDYKAWKMSDIVRTLLTRFTVDAYDVKIVERITQSFSCFCDTYQSNVPHLEVAVKDLREKCRVVMGTIFVRSVIEERANKNKENAYKKKLRGATYEELLEENEPNTRKRKNTENDNETQPKKSERLSVKILKPLPWHEKVRMLCKSFNKGKKPDNRLDITSKGVFPARLAKIHRSIKSNYFVPVQLAIKWEERQVLLRLAKSTSLQDVEDLIKSIPLVSGTEMEKFMFLALTKLVVMWQSGRLQEPSNNEGWFQTHVYGDVLDSAFLLDQGYRTKRTECHAAAIKFLKKAKKLPSETRDVKVDMLVYSREYGDVFVCEDKPEHAPDSEVKADTTKNQQLAENRLAHIQLILPYPRMIKYVEVISAQFHGLILSIYGTKMTEAGDFVHYQKCQVTLPHSPHGHYSQVALFLATVISLQRNLILNLTKLQVLCEVERLDALQYLEPAAQNTKSQSFFREDTAESQSEPEEQVESSDDESDDASEQVREARIMDAAEEKMKNMTYEKDLLTFDNWEDILLMDNRQKAE